VHPQLVNQVTELEGLILKFKPSIIDEGVTVLVVGRFFPSLRNQNHHFLLSVSGSTVEPEPPL
jgi:hypothetical protein